MPPMSLSLKFPPTTKKEQEGKKSNHPQKLSKEKREEIATGPKVDLKPLWENINPSSVWKY